AIVGATEVLRFDGTFIRQLRPIQHLLDVMQISATLRVVTDFPRPYFTEEVLGRSRIETKIGAVPCNLKCFTRYRQSLPAWCAERLRRCRERCAIHPH